jgi:hypothetical protein
MPSEPIAWESLHLPGRLVQDHLLGYRYDVVAFDSIMSNRATRSFWAVDEL